MCDCCSRKGQTPVPGQGVFPHVHPHSHGPGHDHDHDHQHDHGPVFTVIEAVVPAAPKPKP